MFTHKSVAMLAKEADAATQAVADYKAYTKEQTAQADEQCDDPKITAGLKRKADQANAALKRALATNPTGRIDRFDPSGVEIHAALDSRGHLLSQLNGLVAGFADLASDAKQNDRKDVSVLTKEDIQRMLPSPGSKETIQKFVDTYGIDFGELTPYLGLRKNGSVPTGGFGLGFERFVLVCSSSIDGGNIRHTLPFPAAYQELSF
jgi:hypothetical protein